MEVSGRGRERDVGNRERDDKELVYKVMKTNEFQDLHCESVIRDSGQPVM